MRWRKINKRSLIGDIKCQVMIANLKREIREGLTEVATEPRLAGREEGGYPEESVPGRKQ